MGLGGAEDSLQNSTDRRGLITLCSRVFCFLLSLLFLSSYSETPWETGVFTAAGRGRGEVRGDENQRRASFGDAVEFTFIYLSNQGEPGHIPFRPVVFERLLIESTHHCLHCA